MDLVRPRRQVAGYLQEGGCKATRKREFKLPWREAGPPNHHDDQVDSDQQVVKKEAFLSGEDDELRLIAKGTLQGYLAHEKQSLSTGVPRS